MGGLTSLNIYVLHGNTKSINNPLESVVSVHVTPVHAVNSKTAPGAPVPVMLLILCIIREVYLHLLLQELQ